MREVGLEAGALDRERAAVGAQQQAPVGEVPQVATDRLGRHRELLGGVRHVHPALGAGTGEQSLVTLGGLHGSLPPTGPEPLTSL
ncbi:hypothetical protein GCM10027446_21430 [Angustibacter peucedani]